MSEPTPIFPGFRVPPNDPSREIRPALTVASQSEQDFEPQERGEYDGYDSEPVCQACEGWGFFNCFCGGDFCICDYNGERPCWECQ